MADTTKADLLKAAISPHGRPWLAVVGQIPATVAAHAAWSDNAPAAIGMTVASGLLTAATWWGAAGTSPARRIHATITTGAATAYLTAATFADPLGATELSVLVIGGSTLAASWNIRKAMRVQVDGQTADKAATETGLLAKSIGKAKLALRGEPKVEPNKVTAPYKITAPGELTNDEISRRIQHIATELGISPNAIRIRTDADDASRGELVVVPKDMLIEGAAWPGPSSMGGSITEPIYIGIYEDGAPETLWFPADPAAGRNATHFGAFGMNGSAKSTGITFAIIEALTRRDAIVWAADPSKGMQTFKPLLPYLDWVEMTEAGGNAMITALSQVITARANELGKHGYKDWTPEAFDRLGMPYMIVWIEEAARFFRNGTEMEGLVMEARSAGISVIISLQRPSATSMPTDVREQLGGVICFGVKGSTTADMALPDEVRDAGARPEAWENRKPGYNYLVAPGIDEERYATPARTWSPVPDEAIAAVLAQAPRTPTGDITAAAAGEAYANRTRYADEQALTSINTRKADPMPQQAAADDEALLEAQLAHQLLLDDEDDDLMDLDIDIDQDLAPASGTLTLAEPPATDDEDGPELATARLLDVIDQFREEGRDSIGPKDFAPYGKGSRVGRSRGWISEKLGEFADAGVHLAETDKPGVYRLLYPAMAEAV